VQNFHEEGVSVKSEASRVLRALNNPVSLVPAVVDELLGAGMQVEEELVLDRTGRDLVVHTLQKDLDGFGKLKVGQLARVFLEMGQHALAQLRLYHIVVFAKIVEQTLYKVVHLLEDVNRSGAPAEENPSFQEVAAESVYNLASFHLEFLPLAVHSVLLLDEGAWLGGEDLF